MQESNKVNVLLARVEERNRISDLLLNFGSLDQMLKNVCLIHSEMYLNSCIDSVRLKRVMYLNIEIKTDLMCLLLVGGFAFVYEAQDLGSGKDYALKVMLIYFTIGL